MSDVALTVDQIQRVDMVLAPGNVTETVEVQSNALVLDTGSASVGHTITEKQVTELPLNGRNFLQLLFLGAGAVETTGEQGGMRQGVGNAISIMGARPTSNNFMIDGTANIDTSIGTPAAVLSVDAIQEFKEQTTTYSAEYGFSSNQINLVSKTGTNALHGTGFGFFRNDALGREKLLRRQDVAGAEAGSEAVRVRRRRSGDAARYDGRTARSSSSTTRGRGSIAARPNFYTVPTPERAGGTLQHDDHRSGDRRAVPEQHDPAVAILAARAARDPEQLVPRAEHIGGAGQLPGRADVSAGAGPVHASAATRISPRSAACSSAIRTPRYENTTASNTIDPGNRVFVQDTRNWQVSHSWPIRNTLVNQFRMGRVDARADQQGIACRAGGRGLPQRDRACSPTFPTTSASVRASR